MNRIVNQDKEFVVGFEHKMVATSLHGDMPRTKCFIKVGPVGCRDADKELIGLGVVQKHSNDPDNRVLARTLALERALKMVSEHEGKTFINYGVNIRRANLSQYC